VTRSEMNDWLSSDEIAALSSRRDWPTSETAAIWTRFRQDALAAPIRRWIEEEWRLDSSLPLWANVSNLARVFVDVESGDVSIVSADYRKITGIQQGLLDPDPSLLRVDYAADGHSATIKRMGRGAARWVER